MGCTEQPTANKLVLLSRKALIICLDCVSLVCLHVSVFVIRISYTRRYYCNLLIVFLFFCEVIQKAIIYFFTSKMNVSVCIFHWKWILTNHTITDAVNQKYTCWQPHHYHSHYTQPLIHSNNKTCVFCEIEMRHTRMNIVWVCYSPSFLNLYDEFFVSFGYSSLYIFLQLACVIRNQGRKERERVIYDWEKLFSKWATHYPWQLMGALLID